MPVRARASEPAPMKRAQVRLAWISEVALLCCVSQLVCCSACACRTRGMEVTMCSSELRLWVPLGAKEIGLDCVDFTGMCLDAAGVCSIRLIFGAEAARVQMDNVAKVTAPSNCHLVKDGPWLWAKAVHSVVGIA